MKLSEIAKQIGGIIEGNGEIEISNVAKIEEAKCNEITFIANPLYQKYYLATNASAIIVSEDFQANSERTNISLIRTKDPYQAFLKLLTVFAPRTDVPFEISKNAIIESDVILPTNIFVGNFTSIGKQCKIGSNTQIYSNCSIGENIVIGNNCIIYPNVVIYKNCKIGNNVIIHSGTIIGSDGFGFAKKDDGSYEKIPQNGIVVIEDDVEIGSNCTIDRATIGETHIGKGVKLDNQIMIAHNVSIGENTVIAAQVGIAGSTKIGKRCMIGGQSGIVGHITICDDVLIGAAVGVSKSITNPGTYTGYRAKLLKEDLKEQVRIKNLELLEEKIKLLEQKLNKKN